jgi:hypothetical protein
MPVRCYCSIYFFLVAWVNIVNKKIHKHSDLDVSIGQIKHNTPQQLTIPTKVIIHCNFKSSDVKIPCQQFHTNFRKGIHKIYLYFLIHSIAYNCRKDQWLVLTLLQQMAAIISMQSCQFSYRLLQATYRIEITLPYMVLSKYASLQSKLVLLFYFWNHNLKKF